MIPVFVYGTLRPGDYNHSRHGLDEDNVVRGVTAPGALYHVSSSYKAYPCAKFDQCGTIIGDILFFEEGSRDLERIDRMEEGAGYEIREVIVTLPDGSQMKCQAYHYVRDPRGPRIESGDWFNDSTEFLTRSWVDEAEWEEDGEEYEADSEARNERAASSLADPKGSV